MEFRLFFVVSKFFMENSYLNRTNCKLSEECHQMKFFDFYLKGTPHERPNTNCFSGLDRVRKVKFLENSEKILNIVKIVDWGIFRDSPVLIFFGFS